MPPPPSQMAERAIEELASLGLIRPIPGGYDLTPLHEVAAAVVNSIEEEHLEDVCGIIERTATPADFVASIYTLVYIAAYDSVHGSPPPRESTMEVFRFLSVLVAAQMEEENEELTVAAFVGLKAICAGLSEG